MAYQITWEPEGILVEYSGFLTSREMIESATKTQSDHRFDEMRYVINDISRITGHDLTEDSFLDIAAANYGAYASNPNCRIAYVTMDVNIAKIINETLMTPGFISYEIEIKHSVDKARNWLNNQPRLHEMSSTIGIRFT